MQTVFPAAGNWAQYGARPLVRSIHSVLIPLAFEIILQVSEAVIVYEDPTQGRFVGTAVGPVG